MKALLVAGATALVVASGQERRLRINNLCQTEPLWVAHMAAASPGPSTQNLKLGPGESHDFLTPDGLSSTRYWPKFRCDEDGNQCKVGGSGGPSEICDKQVGCAPPVDTKFEATFGIGGPCDPAQGKYAGCDWIDVSLVDGFTVPFKFEIKGDCPGASSKVIDCSHISVDMCPTSENLGAVGNVDLRVVHPTTGKVSGCYSPCSKLTLRQWNNPVAAHHIPQDAESAPYCCPTPPESPDACKKGPVSSTQYVQKVHSMCPGVYGYAYDDGMGLVQCPAVASYEVSFYCPGSAPPSPGPSPPPPTPTPGCKVGDMVQCPGNTASCAGNQCCPDGSTCPSAAKDFAGCPAPKKKDCTTSESGEGIILA